MKIHERLQEKTVKFIGGAVAAYVVAKVVHTQIKDRRAEKSADVSEQNLGEKVEAVNALRRRAIETGYSSDKLDVIKAANQLGGKLGRNLALSSILDSMVEYQSFLDTNAREPGKITREVRDDCWLSIDALWVTPKSASCYEAVADATRWHGINITRPAAPEAYYQASLAITGEQPPEENAQLAQDSDFSMITYDWMVDGTDFHREAADALAWNGEPTLSPEELEESVTSMLEERADYTRELHSAINSVL